MHGFHLNLFGTYNVRVKVLLLHIFLDTFFKEITGTVSQTVAGRLVNIADSEHWDNSDSKICGEKNLSL